MAEKKINRRTISPSGKITRKITPVGKPVAKVEQIREVKQPEAVEESEIKGKARKGCFFCQKKLTPSYTDVVSLRRFLTDRAKIIAKERSGVCSKHQRQVAKHIKYARHLSLLPFVPKV